MNYEKRFSLPTSPESKKRRSERILKPIAAIAIGGAALLGGGAAVNEFTKIPVEIASSTGTAGQGEGTISVVEDIANDIEKKTGIELSQDNIMYAATTAEQSVDGIVRPGMQFKVTVVEKGFGRIDAIGSLVDSDEK